MSGRIDVVNVQTSVFRKEKKIERHDQIKPWDIKGQTAFNEVQTAEFSPLIELDSSNGLSTVRRDTVTVTGSGAVTNANGEHKVATGTTAGSTAGLRTKERGRYQPGIEALPGVAIRRPTAPTGDAEIRAGYFDSQDGLWVGEDSKGIFAQYRHSGTTEAKVYQADWNGDDKLDGNGDSGVTLDFTRYAIVRFPFAWYGAGPLRVAILTNGPSGTPNYTIVHRFDTPTGAPVLGNPKLPITVEVDNGTTTTDLPVYVGGRHFAVVGRYRPNRRNTPEQRLNVTVAASTTEPLISFRKKTDRTSEGKAVRIITGGVISSQKGVLKVYLAPTLTGATFGAVSEVGATETALESDVSATAISGGTLIRTLLIAPSRNNAFSKDDLSALLQVLPDETIVTLAFENATATDATVDATFELEEEW